MLEKSRFSGERIQKQKYPTSAATESTPSTVRIRMPCLVWRISSVMLLHFDAITRI